MPKLLTCQCGGVVDVDGDAPKRQMGATCGECRACGERVGVAIYAGEPIGLFPMPTSWTVEDQARIGLLVGGLARKYQFRDPDVQAAAEAVDMRLYSWRLRRPWRWIPARFQPHVFTLLRLNQAKIVVKSKS